MVTVSDSENGVNTYAAYQIQRRQRPKASFRHLPLPYTDKDAMQDNSIEDLKVNTTIMQSVAASPSAALSSKSNNLTCGRQGMIVNDESKTNSNAAISKVISSRINKVSSTTHPKAPDHCYRHAQLFLPVNGVSAKKVSKSSPLSLLEINQSGVSTNACDNSINKTTQRGTRRIFFQKEINTVSTRAEQPNLLSRSLAGSSPASTAVYSPKNSTSNEDVGAAIKKHNVPSLMHEENGKKSKVTTGEDAAAVIPSKDANAKACRDTTINNVRASTEPKDNNASVILNNHVNPLDIMAERPSPGISAYLSARENQMASAVSPSTVPSSRRKQALAVPIPHYSVPHCGAPSNFRSATRRKPTETTPAMKNAESRDAQTPEPALDQETLNTRKGITRLSLLSVFKLNPVLQMSNIVKPEAPRTRYPITTHPLEMSKRGVQPHKIMAVFLSKYPIIRTVGREMGFSVQETERELDDSRFNLCWSDTMLSPPRLMRLENWQRSNHFPLMLLLCQKSHLSTTLSHMKCSLPNHFRFFPQTWNLPRENFNFQHYFSDLKQRGISRYFIIKPSIGCQGRGIIVTNDPLGEVKNMTNFVVQEYIQRPLLFEGRKFDLRVYVLLMSIRKPSIFMFNDGLVRICTEKYDPPTFENAKNAFKHLTNYAINKHSTNYVFNTDAEKGDVGNKRNFKFMNSWLEGKGCSVSDFWDRVGFLVVKTIMSAQPQICRMYDNFFSGYNEGYTCFEVLGFDILVDYKLKPWLLEVNHTPSFATDTPLDLDIKGRLIKEVLDIVGCSVKDREQDRRREREEFTQRNMPPWTKKKDHHSQWSYALNLLQQNNDNTNNRSSNVGVSSSTMGTVIQRQDKDDLSPSSHHPVRSHLESDSDMFDELVRLHRKREDAKLVNFKRVYPSSDPEIQNVYDTIHKVAATILTTTPGTVKSCSSRSYASSQAHKAVSSTSSNAQHLCESKRVMHDLKSSGRESHPNIPGSASTFQAIANCTDTTFLDTPTSLQRVMLYNKQSDQPKNSNTHSENFKSDQQPPSQLSKKNHSSNAEPIKVEDKCTNQYNTFGLSNGVAHVDGIMTSTAVGGDTPQLSHPVLPEMNITAMPDEMEPTPAPHLDESLSSICLEQGPVPTEAESILNEDVPLIKVTSVLSTSQSMSPCPPANEMHAVEQANLPSSARTCSSVEKTNHKRFPAELSEQEPRVEELHGLENFQQQLNVSDPKDSTEFESFDLSD